jgi:hypothetical protein
VKQAAETWRAAILAADHKKAAKIAALQLLVVVRRL